MYMHIFLNITLSLYNVTYVYVFKADCLVYDNQQVWSSALGAP